MKNKCLWLVLTARKNLHWDKLGVIQNLLEKSVMYLKNPQVPKQWEHHTERQVGPARH